MDRDPQSFQIRFEFESDDSDSIRFKSVGMSCTCRRTTNHTHCSLFNKKLQPLRRCRLIEIYFISMILCLCSKSIGYTFASIIGAIMQHCLRNQLEESAHLFSSVIIIITSFFTQLLWQSALNTQTTTPWFDSWFDSNAKLTVVIKSVDVLIFTYYWVKFQILTLNFVCTFLVFPVSKRATTMERLEDLIVYLFQLIAPQPCFDEIFVKYNFFNGTAYMFTFSLDIRWLKSILCTYRLWELFSKIV